MLSRRRVLQLSLYGAGILSGAAPAEAITERERDSDPLGHTGFPNFDSVFDFKQLPTSLGLGPGMSQTGSAVTDYFSDQRMEYLGSDLIVCGPAISGLFGGLAVPIAEAAFVFAAAQCVPNLLADALAPLDVIPPYAFDLFGDSLGIYERSRDGRYFGEKYFLLVQRLRTSQRI